MIEVDTDVDGYIRGEEQRVEYDDVFTMGKFASDRMFRCVRVTLELVLPGPVRGVRVVKPVAQPWRVPEVAPDAPRVIREE